jgi:hypothetical protein
MAGAASTTKKRSMIAAVILLAFILLAVVLYLTGAYEALIVRLGILQEEEVVPESTFFEYVPKGTADMAVLDGNVIITDESGVSCFNKDGDWLWSKELSLTSPVCVSAGNEVLIADIGGTGVHCFDKNGFLWTYIAEDTITGISENCRNGKFLVIHKSAGYLSAATLLDISSEGKALASRKFGECYAVSASFTEDGSKLAITGIRPETGTVSNVFTFMKTDSYDVYSTETVSDEFLPLVSFADGDHLFAAGGESLRRIVKKVSTGTSGDSNDILWNRDGGALQIVAACSVPGKYFITVSAATGADEHMEASCEVSIYESSGDKYKSFSAPGGIIGIRFSGKTLALYTENELYVYNISGQLIGKFDSVSQITDVEFLSERVFAVCGAAKMAKADFKR